MNRDTSPVLVACTTIILVTVLAGVFTLAWHGTLSGAEVYGTVSTIIAGVLGVFAVHSGVTAGGKAASLGSQTHAEGVREGSQATASPPPDG